MTATLAKAKQKPACVAGTMMPDRQLASEAAWPEKPARRRWSISGRTAQALPVWGFLLAVCFGMIYFLVDAYTLGDQVSYRFLYDLLGIAAASRVLAVQIMAVSGAEPLYGYLMWVGAQLGIDKDIWVTGFNTLFVLLIVLFLRRHKAAWPVYPLILTNYYFFVLLTSAERLKFSFIVLLMAALATGWKRAILLFGAPLFHFQTLIFYAAILSGRLKSIRFSRHVKPQTMIALVLGLTISGVVLPLVIGNILEKVIGYASRYEPDPMDLYGGAVLIIVGLVVLRRQITFLLALLPIIVCAIVLGPHRVNMIGVILLVAFAVTDRRAHHPLMLALLAYFSIKSFGFVHDVFTTGTGYEEEYSVMWQRSLSRVPLGRFLR